MYIPEQPNKCPRIAAGDYVYVRPDQEEEFILALITKIEGKEFEDEPVIVALVNEYGDDQDELKITWNAGIKLKETDPEQWEIIDHSTI